MTPQNSVLHNPKCFTFIVINVLKDFNMINENPLVKYNINFDSKIYMKYKTIIMK